jgi:hypothetical protein
MEEKKLYDDLSKEVLLLRRELLEIQKKEKIGFWDWLFYVYIISIPFKNKTLKLPILPLHLILFYFFYKFIVKPLVGLGGFGGFSQTFLSILATFFIFYIFYSKLVHFTKEKKQQTLISYFKYYYPIVLRKIKHILGLE